jgi:hypothetical protein
LCTALIAKDKHVGQKLLQLAATIPAKSPFGPSCKAEWLDIYTKRVAAMHWSPASIVFDATFAVNWDLSGHFKLLPVKPELVAPEDHKYEMISFKGIEVPVGSDLVIRGTWHICENWDHMAACVFKPEKAWRREPCKSFFRPKQILDAAPDITPSTPDLLSIENEKPLDISDDVAVAIVPVTHIICDGSVSDVVLEDETISMEASSSSASVVVVAQAAVVAPTIGVGVIGVKKPPSQPPARAAALEKAVALLAAKPSQTA